MIRHATGTDISADFGESQIIADPAIPLNFERLAALRWPLRWLPAGALLKP